MQRANEPPPLVILISIDTLRHDQLGVFGNTRCLTPALDKLARDGVVFNRAYSQAGVTLPSHASMLTSQYPSSLGIVSDAQIVTIPETYKTVSQLMKQRGYRTISFTGGGGVDHVYGYDRDVDLWVQDSNFQMSVNAIIPILEEAFGSRNHSDERQQSAADRQQPATEVRQVTAGRREPTGSPPKFFIFLHSYEVHTPYTPLPNLERLYEDQEYYHQFQREWHEFIARYHTAKIDWPMYQAMSPEEKAGLLNVWMLEGNLRAAVTDPETQDRIETDETTSFVPNEWPQLADYGRQLHLLRDSYALATRNADAQLNRLFQAVNKLGLWERSLIIVTADHGEEFMEHGQLLHPCLGFDTLMNVPLILKLPTSMKTPRGVCDRLAGNIDILPSLVQLCRLQPPLPLAGISLLELLQHKNRNDQRQLFAEFGQPDGRLNNVMIVEGAIKTIRREGKLSLYDLDSDPGEKTESADTRQALATALDQAMTEHLKNYIQPTPRPKERDLANDPEVQRLRKKYQELGYPQ